MKTSFAIATLAALVVLQAVGAAAADPAPFTSRELGRFIDVLPKYIRFIETQGQALDDIKDPGVWQVMAVSGRMQDFFTRHDWKPERFFYVAAHAAMGLAAAEWQHQQPSVTAEMESAREEIRNNPDLPEEMKQQLLQNLDQAGAAQAGLDQLAGQIPAQEMALIQANRERLREVFDRAR
jgi:hypothetical protein